MTEESAKARSHREDTTADDEVITKHKTISERLGRYELVSQLGRGGMARVYLARASGPGGFHKWLAIKRIHPHLAEEQRFVNMFLDEARIAAAIQHTNVAQVFELAKDEGELFMVMEYLHGEHLGSVWLAARKKYGHLPYRLAASIMASTARGLHHAHESKDAFGRPLELIHRDITPHNIFVTYGGEIRVTDFGIAKAAGRITKTESGGIKGKWAYMAPEQVLQEEVDRRTDIFALGVVAWELTTGERLFKSESEMHTGMRITSGYVVLPSEIVPDFPESLERIIIKSLERRPEDRYQSVGDVVTELDRCIERELGGAARITNEISSVMHELFAERIDAREADLEAFAGSSESSATRTADDEDQLSELERSKVAVREQGSESKPTESPIRLVVLAVIAVVISAVGISLGFYFMDVGPSQGVEVRIASRPVGAAVTLDGERRRGKTPLVLSGVSAGTHQITLELDGHQHLTENIVVRDRPVDHVYHLRPTQEEPQGQHSQDAAQETNTDAIEELPAKGRNGHPPPDDVPVTPAKVSGQSKERGPRPTKSRPQSPAFLNLTSRPWSAVTINGRQVGETPIVRHEVPPGRLVIRFTKQGKGPVRTIRVTARPGQTISRRAVFEGE